MTMTRRFVGGSAAVVVPSNRTVTHHETLAHYDNSAANKSNPDPTQRVVYGPEIMNGYFDYTPDSQRYRRDTSGQ